MNNSGKMPQGAVPFPFGDCKVCQDRATGVHYGVATCEGCKGFFKRSTIHRSKYKCFFGGSCKMTPQTRNRCKSCRFKRCQNLGMSLDAVKMGRIPKEEKERALEMHRKQRENPWSKSLHETLPHQHISQQNTTNQSTSNDLGNESEAENYSNNEQRSEEIGMMNVRTEPKSEVISMDPAPWVNQDPNSVSYVSYHHSNPSTDQTLYRERNGRLIQEANENMNFTVIDSRKEFCAESAGKQNNIQEATIGISNEELTVVKGENSPFLETHLKPHPNSAFPISQQVSIATVSMSLASDRASTDVTNPVLTGVESNSSERSHGSSGTDRASAALSSHWCTDVTATENIITEPGRTHLRVSSQAEQYLERPGIGLHDMTRQPLIAVLPTSHSHSGLSNEAVAPVGPLPPDPCRYAFSTDPEHPQINSLPTEVRPTGNQTHFYPKNNSSFVPSAYSCGIDTVNGELEHSGTSQININNAPSIPQDLTYREYQDPSALKKGEDERDTVLGEASGGIHDNHPIVVETMAKLNALYLTPSGQTQMMLDEISGRRKPHYMNTIKAATRKEARFLWHQLFEAIPEINTHIIGFCQAIPGISNLDEHDQEILLKNSYFDIWLVHCSTLYSEGDFYLRLKCGGRYSRWWMSHFLSPDLVKDMTNLSESLNSSFIGPNLQNIICGLRLTDPSFPNLKNEVRVRTLHNHFLDVLSHAIASRNIGAENEILIYIMKVIGHLKLVGTKLKNSVGQYNPEELPEYCHGRLIEEDTHEENGDER